MPTKQLTIVADYGTPVHWDRQYQERAVPEPACVGGNGGVRTLSGIVKFAMPLACRRNNDVNCPFRTGKRKPETAGNRRISRKYRPMSTARFTVASKTPFHQTGSAGGCGGIDALLRRYSSL